MWLTESSSPGLLARNLTIVIMDHLSYFASLPLSPLVQCWLAGALRKSLDLNAAGSGSGARSSLVLGDLRELLGLGSSHERALAGDDRSTLTRLTNLCVHIWSVS